MRGQLLGVASGKATQPATPVVLKEGADEALKNARERDEGGGSGEETTLQMDDSLPGAPRE
eukprot:855554-Rhodomonas_salina.2